MNSILRNASLLKTTLAQKHPSSLNILEYSLIFTKFPKNANRPVLPEHLNYSTSSSEQYVRKINKRYTWLEFPKTKSFSTSLMKISYRPNQKFRRFFCQNSSKKSERDIRRRQADKKDHSKRDNTCIEDCITVTDEKCKKKNVQKRGDVKFTVNLNNIINDINKKKNIEKQHEANKINNFIFKPVECKSCAQKRRSSSKKSKQVNHQKRTSSSYSVIKKNYPRYEKKEEKFQRQSYDETATYNPRLELLTFLNNNKKEKGALLVKGKGSVTNIRSKSTVPLFLLVKCHSSKSKTLSNYTRNVKYKVGTNEAFIKVYSDTKKTSKGSLSAENTYEFVNGFKETNNEITNPESVSSKRGKSNDKKLQLYQRPTDINKPVLAKAIYEILKPLIEQEYLQYKEVKEAIERLERNLQYHFNKNRSNESEIQIYRSLSNINHLRTGQSQLNLSEKTNKEIDDPKINLEIIEPLENNQKKGDPSTERTISVPCVRKEKIFDPNEYEITIIAKDCIDKLRKNDGSDGNNDCQDKKKDPCKKETNKDVCIQEKKGNECKKTQEAKKKKDPCRQMKIEKNICNEIKDKDNCNQIKEDSCNDKKKYVVCEKKDSRQKKQPNPCEKEDICKKSSSTDDCFKQKSSRHKDSRIDLNDHSCIKAKKKVDNFGETSATCCDKDEKITQKEESCKKHDQGCKHDKEDPCKNFKPKKKPTKEEICGKSGRNADDSCKKFNENKINQKCEQNIPRKDCMKPSEVTCTKGNSMKPRPCCEQVSVCEEPKLPMIKPKCSDENPKRDNSKKASEKKPDHCKQIPMPADCPMKIDSGEKSQNGDSITCTQKSCTQKSMEPTEPPNCCKPRSKKEDIKCTKTFEGQQVIEEKKESKQISCQEITKQKEEAARLTKIPTCPSKTILPKKVKDSSTCPTVSKSDTRYCTKLSKKEKEYVPEQANPAKIPRQHHEENCIQRTTPKSREPRQVPKDTWMPVKINKGKHSKNNLQKTKSTPCTKKEISSKSTCPKLNSVNTKDECSQKSFLDNCKGIVSSVYRILCPGKNKKSGKKAASLGLIRSLSLPEIKGLTGGTLTASSGSNYSRKKPGTMCFAHYKTKNKYPWKQTNRWILYNERFLSKKSDPCDSGHKEKTAPEANKLNCVCYEEMKKVSEKRSKNQTEIEEVCEKNIHAESTKHLNFKLTDHSKICQAASKSKMNSKIKKCNSRPKQDQSMFNQCGEICKQAKSIDYRIKTVTQDECESLSSISTVKKNQEQKSCLDKLKNSTEAAVKEDSSKRVAEQIKSCLDKLKNEGTTKQKEEHVEQKHKTTTIERDCQSLKKPCSILRSKSSVSFKHKYPWQKSEEKMDAELCPNQSNITMKSTGLEKRHRSENICTKPNIKSINQSDHEKQEKGDLTGKNRYTLEVEKDRSCFKGQEKKGQSNPKQKSASEKGQLKDYICNKPNIKESAKDLPTKGQEKDGKCDITKKDNKVDITEKKKFSLENKKESCCFKVCEKDTAKKENKEPEQKDKYPTNQGNNDLTMKGQLKEGKCLIDKKDMNKEGLTEKKKFSLENKKESCCFKACERDITKKEKKGQEKDDKCLSKKAHEEVVRENENKKYILDKKKDSLCFNEKPKRSQSEPKNICEGIKKSKNENTEECSNYNKECKKENLKNLLENYNKTIEKMLAKDEKSSENAKKGSLCEKRSHIEDGTVKTSSIKDICSKIRKTESRGEQKIKNQQCQKTVESQKSDKPGPTRQKGALGLNDIKIDENENDVFICKVKKLGKSEQFICSTKGGECKMSSEPEKGVVRVLKCKLTKDDCGRDVFVCKEIKPVTAGVDRSEVEYEKMKRLLKHKSFPELPTKRMTITKKLVCRERTEDGSNEVQNGKICNVHEVREIVEGKSIKKPQSESSRKKCPFSYKDLLKKSEQLRKASNTESSKKDKSLNKKDCKDKLKTS